MYVGCVYVEILYKLRLFEKRDNVEIRNTVSINTMFWVNPVYGKGDGKKC